MLAFRHRLASPCHLLSWPAVLPAGLPSFWAAAAGGTDLQREVPLDRWDVEAGYDPSTSPQGMTIYARFAAFCTGGWGEAGPLSR